MKIRRNIIIIIVNILIILLVYSLIYFRISWGNRIFIKDYVVGRNSVTYFKNANFTFDKCRLIVYGKLIIDNSIINIDKHQFLVKEKGEILASNSKISNMTVTNYSKSFLRDCVSYEIYVFDRAFLQIIGGRYNNIYAGNNKKISLKDSEVNSIFDLNTTKSMPIEKMEGIGDIWQYNFYQEENFTTLGRNRPVKWGGLQDFIHNRDGLCLSLGGQGTLVYRLDLPRKIEKLTMKLWFCSEENSIAILSQNGQVIEEIGHNKIYRGALINLTKYCKNSKFLLIRFFAANTGTVGNEVILPKVIFYGSYKVG